MKMVLDDPAGVPDTWIGLPDRERWRGGFLMNLTPRNV